MLTALFAEEDAISDRMEGDGRCGPDGKTLSKRVPLPPPPRHSSGICGIANQGATCYLNSLLQTLFFTGQFRERLFELGEDQLGKLAGENGNAKTRIIPLQLQRLFARMLLLDVETASTVELTDSFGWTNNEELQQHDVQELNRILFQAIESSLVGTSGHGLVKDLYNGRVVNQISCLECNNVSEREEDFLDLNVTVGGNDSLTKAFTDMFVNTERMDGNNRYQCAKCGRLTDAVKGARIRTLPKIFTVSLLRFTYDLVKFQRFKETSKFSFPTELDMRPFFEGSATDASSPDADYELFSVIVHKGSCYGGHYHCYIRDTEGIGKWTPPEEEKISLPTISSGKVDYLAFDDPSDIISALLVQTPNNSMTLDRLCAEITRVTGVSWNKRFKRSFGNITKFLKTETRLFHFNEATKTVTLLQINQQRFTTGHIDWENTLEVTVGRASEVTPNSHAVSSNTLAPEKKANDSAAASEASDPAPNDEAAAVEIVSSTKAHWFNLDDSRVKSVREADLEGQFSGKESAYMLFYRRKSPRETSASLYDMPVWLLEEMAAESSRLERQRAEYEDEINRLTVSVLFASDFVFRNGAIAHAVETNAWNLTTTTMVLDRRKNLDEMVRSIQEAAGEKLNDRVAVNLVRQFPAGLQLLNCLVSPDSSSATSSPISTLSGLMDGALLFAWNGRDVGGVAVPAEAFVEPVVLEIRCQRLGEDGCPFQDSVTHAFPKSMSLAEFRDQLPTVMSSRASSDSSPTVEALPADCTIARVRGGSGGVDTAAANSCFQTLLLDRDQDEKTFLELDLIDYDAILVDLTGFSNQVDASNPSKQTWASAARTDTPHSTDGISANDSEIPASSMAKNLSKTPSDISSVCQPPIRVAARVKSVAAGFQDLRIEVNVQPTMTVGKLKFVIIDAVKKTSGIHYSAVTPNQSPAKADAAASAHALTSPTSTRLNDEAAGEPSGEDTPRLNGKFLRLRILEENFGPRTPLVEKKSLEESGVKDGTTVIVEDGVAPKPNQMTLSFTRANGVAAETEIIVEKDCVISDCIRRMVQLLSISAEEEDAEGWHLRKTNWEGEAVEAVEDASVTLEQEGIKDGDHVLLEEGVVPPKGFLRLPVWLLVDESRMRSGRTHAARENLGENVNSDSPFATLKLLQAKAFVGHVELTQDTTLLVLKQVCMKLLEKKSLENPGVEIWPSMADKVPQNVRLATIGAKGIQGSVLKGHRATLKVLHVTNAVQLLLSVLEKTEDPSPTQVILRTYFRLPETKTYESKGEVLWETAGAGATAASLRTAVSQALELPSTELVVAKYFPDKFEWLILTDAKPTISLKKQYGKQSSKKGAGKKNLRQSPFYIQDGDIIGVKTVSSDPLHLDNFLTEADEDGKRRLVATEEDKRRRRQENRQRQNSDSHNVVGGGGVTERKARPEVALTIHVPKYE